VLRDDGAEDPLYVSRKKQSPVNDTGFVQWRANISQSSDLYSTRHQPLAPEEPLRILAGLVALAGAIIPYLSPVIGCNRRH
jgi:hypothetical protein